MYLLITAIPIFNDGSVFYLQNDWLTDVLLARDWLAPPFGHLTLLAPWRPIDRSKQLERVDPMMGIEVVAALDDRSRSDQFWRTGRKQWLDAVRQHLSRADVVHTTMDGLWRPMGQMAFIAAHSAGVPTVFVGPDMDLHESWKDRIRSASWPMRTALRLYLMCWDRALLHHVRMADLSLLKEGAVNDRYEPFATHSRAFCHTMYSRDDVVAEPYLEKRIASLDGDRPLRLVYCGRLVGYKGVHVSVDLIMRARQKGARVEFDIIGSGPEEEAMRQQVKDLRLENAVRFLGAFPYEPGLIRRLSEYDILLYTPTEEDTPRMLYDGYAAGLPVLGTEIPFVRHRAKTDQACITFPVHDVERGSEALQQLDRNRGSLGDLMRRARLAGMHHALETWYGRRRDWTVATVERCRLESAAKRLQRQAK